MNWIRFDKQLPPEDTTVLVSNGPAVGNYHFKADFYFLNSLNIVPLWTMEGVRIECAVKDLTQWTKILKTTVQREALQEKQSRWQKLKSKLKQILSLTNC